MSIENKNAQPKRSEPKEEKPKCDRCMEKVESDEDLFCVDAVPKYTSAYVCSICLNHIHGVI